MITQERLKEALQYDPETGLFIWKIQAARRTKIGSLAGSIQKDGKNQYLIIQIDKKLYRAHRLAWLYVHGKFPDNQIDHVDGNGLNNRISNLRDVSVRENQKNISMNSKNTSGAMGVDFHKSKGKWRARIKTESGSKFIGYFNDVEDAISARKQAEIDHGYHENHGRAS